MSIDKPSVDSFLATSSRCFADPLLRSEGVCALDKRFDKRLWISTTNKWGRMPRRRYRTKTLRSCVSVSTSWRLALSTGRAS